MTNNKKITDSGFTYRESSGVDHGQEDTTQGDIEHDKLKKINKKFIDSYVNPSKETWGTNVFPKYNVKVPDGDVVTNTLMNDPSRWGGGPKKPEPIPPISTILPGDTRHEKAVKTIYHATGNDPTILTTLNVPVPTFQDIIKKKTHLGGKKTKKSRKSRKSKKTKKSKK